MDLLTTNDTMICRCFSAILGNALRKSFSKLPAEGITSWDQREIILAAVTSLKEATYIVMPYGDALSKEI